jgi:hypothetical protein
VLRLTALLRGLGLEVDFKAEAVGVEVLGAEQIRTLSHGRVEAASLFSQKLFGPTKDYECECGQYKRMKHRGVVCEKCGVEVIQSKVRRERFCHVELAAPCVHPLLGTPLELVPVFPPDLRAEPSPLNAAYERLISAGTADVGLSLGMKV